MSGALYSAGTNGVSSNINILAAGTLDVTGAGSLGLSSDFDGTIANDGTFNYNSTTDQELSGIISGAGALTKDNTSTLTLTGVNTYTGATTISAGTLQLDGSLTSAVTVASGANLDGEGSTTGALVFSGTTHTINADVGTAAALGSTTSTDVSALNVGGFTVNVTGSATGAQDVLTYGTSFTGALDRFVVGTGTVSARGQTFADSGSAITLDLGFENKIWVGGVDGNWDINSTANWSGGSDALYFDGDNVTFNDTATTKAVVINGANVAPGSVTFSNTSGGGAYTLSSAAGQTLDGSGGISATGTGDVTISSDIIGSGGFTQSGTGTTILSGANTYTGVTNINAGTLVADVADVAATSGALGNGDNITFTGGTLQYTANSAGSDYSARILNSTSAISVDTNGEDVTWGTALSTTNTGGLTKEGTGTLIISAKGNNAGVLTVNDGTLEISATVTGNTPDYTSYQINNGSTLFFNETTASNIVLGVGIGDITFGSSDPGGTLQLNGNTIFRNQTITTTGGAKNFITGGTFNLQNSRSIIFNTAVGTDVDGIDLEVSATISGGDIIKDGAGTVSLTNSANNLGTQNGGGLGEINTVTINAGTLEIGGAGRLVNGNYAGAISNAGIFKYNSTNAQELSGVISGAGSLEKDNTGTLTLSGLNTYTGNTTVDDGILQIGGAGRLQTGATGFYSGDIAIASGATFQYSSSASNTDARYNGTISGDGTLIKDGSTSILRLQGTTSVANIEINQGTLRVQGNVDALGGAGTTVTIGASGSENAILQYAGSNLTYTTKAAIVVGAGSTGTKTILNGGNDNVENTTITLEDDVIIDDSGTFTLGGVISGTGGLTKTDVGTTTLSGVNTYTGNTTISAGTLELSGGSAIADAGHVQIADVAGATLHLNADETIGSLAGGGTTGGNVDLDTFTLTTGDAGNDTYSGSISGSGAFTKDGAGTQTLSGANTYTGVTTVSVGTLLINGDNSLANGDVEHHTAMRTLGGIGTIGGAPRSR